MSSAPLRSKKKMGRAPRALLGACLTLALVLLLSWVAARGLIVGVELKRADALVVLAGSATYVERTRKAAALFAEGRAPLIVLTNDNLPGGWSKEEQRNPLFVERAAEELRHHGVPSEKIEIIWQPVTSTYDETMCLREYAAARGLRSIIVVTSAYHSRRALWMLRRVFRESDVAVGLEAAPTGQQTPPPATWWWYRLGWKMVPGEYLKLFYYRWRYR